ncbi:MAG: hypothetical protein M1325_01505, partial [Actinobacteria bacterium]|nr:hypothetical protein [Actinomycetota bacterium]
MKNSGLGSLFRATERRRQEDAAKAALGQSAASFSSEPEVAPGYEPRCGFESGSDDPGGRPRVEGGLDADGGAPAKMPPEAGRGGEQRLGARGAVVGHRCRHCDEPDVEPLQVGFVA